MITVNYEEKKNHFGNHLFQYSVCRLIAEKNNYKFHIKYPNHLLDCFPDLYLGDFDGQIKYEYSENVKEQKYNPDLFKISDFTNLSGYFQSPKYFESSEEIVKSWFQIKFDDEVDKVLSKYSPDDYCFIHLRGTDYKNLNWTLPLDYYKSAMKEIQNLKSEISFVVVTDDPELSKKLFPNTEILTEKIHQHGTFGIDGVRDFKSLYFSKYSIISASTFSWWAAWLSLDDKKCVIAPSNWLNYNKPELGFYPNDIKTNNFLYLDHK